MHQGLFFKALPGVKKTSDIFTRFEIFESKLRLAEFYEIPFIITGVHLAVVLSAF